MDTLKLFAFTSQQNSFEMSWPLIHLIRTKLILKWALSITLC